MAAKCCYLLVVAKLDLRAVSLTDSSQGWVDGYFGMTRVGWRHGNSSSAADIIY